MQLAFYAPMKPPDHPVPSGDRQMARLLMRALALAGFEPELASRFRSHAPAPDELALAAAAARERDAVSARWDAMQPAQRPRAWVTYHPYYKAPDLIGPEIAARFAIPYVTAEASYAGKRDRDEWAGLQRTVKSAVRAAALNVCFTAEDREGLARLVGPERLGDLAPFIDADPFLAMPRAEDPRGLVRLVTVGMMRGGVKLASYRMLAHALGRIADAPWSLTVVGDGPQRAAVAEAFASLPADRVQWTGEIDAPALAEHLGAADVFVWPGTGEAYGIAYLEAQAAGLPVVAQATGGVPAVVRHDVTGLLTPPGDEAAFAAAIARLVNDRGLRLRFGTAARDFVAGERSLPAAAARLRALLAPLLAPAPVS
ncbi:MAG: glycosyltransferase family 4 protein [Hyphomicrobiales bacterium]